MNNFALYYCQKVFQSHSGFDVDLNSGFWIMVVMDIDTVLRGKANRGAVFELHLRGNAVDSLPV